MSNQKKPLEQLLNESALLWHSVPLPMQQGITYPVADSKSAFDAAYNLLTTVVLSEALPELYVKSVMIQDALTVDHSDKQKLAAKLFSSGLNDILVGLVSRNAQLQTWEKMPMSLQ
jgi:hypothetical protein